MGVWLVLAGSVGIENQRDPSDFIAWDLLLYFLSVARREKDF